MTSENLSLVLVSEMKCEHFKIKAGYSSTSTEKN